MILEPATTTHTTTTLPRGLEWTMVRLLGALAADMLLLLLLLLCVAEELQLGVAAATFRGFYLPPAGGSLLAPARRTDGIVRTVDRIYHGGGKAGYLLYLDGRRFQLDLERDEAALSHLSSDRYVLAMMGQSGAEEEQQQLHQRECVYRGTVDSQPESLAVFNLCGGGLEGFFAVSHARYAVTPIVRARGHEHDARALQDRDAESALHVFTREGFSFEAASDGRESCGTRDARRRRERRGGRARRARRRRSVSRARHVELLLVADATMERKYGRDLQHYLLTLASIASRLYGHASIENPVRLSVVKVTVLGERDARGLEVSQNAAATLKSFCKWQNQQNPLDEQHPQHHDAAILFTRQVTTRSTHTVSGTCSLLFMNSPSSFKCNITPFFLPLFHFTNFLLPFFYPSH